jgi:tRNA-dihydrouridine synthase B
MLKSISFDHIHIDTPILLAPLSGISDVPFRHNVLNYWAGMVYSEMIASRTQIQDVKSSYKLIEKAKNQRYSAIQLAGYEPYYISEAVKINTDLGADLIDLNFGCPAKKIVTNVAGSALMHPDNLERAKQIIEAAVKATHLPVTLKMRLGWDYEMLTGCELAKIAQDLGIKMLTVHGRTRCQFYEGQANWQEIAKIRQVTQLPLIVNGDIKDSDTARQALTQSGADGIMVGRASCGKPWLLHQLKTELIDNQPYKIPDKSAIITMIINHYQHIISFYDYKKGLVISRKHLHWYRENLQLPPIIDIEFKNIINIENKVDNIIEYLLNLTKTTDTNLKQ